MADEVIEALPWERLPEESTPAYAAFMTFLDMGLTRSLAGAYRLSQGAKGEDRGETGGKTRTHRQAASHWEAWHSKNCWPERALAYDRHQRLLTDQEARKVLRERLIDYHRRMEAQAQIFEKFIQGTENVLLPQLVRLTNEPQDISARDIVYALGKLSALTDTWLGLEASALRMPEIITLFNEREG